jgi:predicted nucleic acid-binding protein
MIDSLEKQIYPFADLLSIIPLRAIVKEAINIATIENITVYDAIYIALASHPN